MAPMPKSLRRRQVVSEGPVRGPGGSESASERETLDGVLGIIADWHKDPKRRAGLGVRCPKSLGINSDQGIRLHQTTVEGHRWWRTGKLLSGVDSSCVSANIASVESPSPRSSQPAGRYPRHSENFMHHEAYPRERPSSGNNHIHTRAQKTPILKRKKD